MTRISLFPIVFLALPLAAPAPAQAAWLHNGTAVCTVPNFKSDVDAVSDGQGGILIVWSDQRGGFDNDVYAQRLDGWGNELWTPGGAQISSGAFLEDNPRITSDGAGGAIVVWQHALADFNIHAQRIGAAGNVLWQANGVFVCQAFLNQTGPQLIPDGSGGALIAWEDVRVGNWDIYAQRIDASGVPQWPLDGRPICAQANDQFRPQLVTDGMGGAYLAWEDFRNSFQYDIYMQRIGSFGLPQYAADGVPICNNGANQMSVRLASLDIGGMVAVWRDERTGPFNPTTWAQRVTSSGTVAWAANGIQVCTTGAPEFDAQVVPDNDHGVIVAWQDGRIGPEDIFAQRLDVTGTRLWTPGGVNLTNDGLQQYAPRMSADGNGGAYVSWVDTRYAPEGDILVGHVDAAGTPSNGVPMAVVQGQQGYASIVGDGAGGAITAWPDSRGGPDPSIYAQRIERYGNWGYPSAGNVSASDIPGDQGGQVNLTWDASRLDPWPAQTIDRYTIWRSLDAALASLLLKSGASPRLSVEAVHPGVKDGIRVETSAAGTSYWQLIASVDAYHLASYSYAAPTLFDSTVTSPGLHSFQVIAHHDFGDQYWISQTASARSVDNLAPAAPLFLSAQRVGSDVLLKWNPSGEEELDFSAYAVYRASSAGVQPVPGFFVTDSPDTLLTDVNPPAGFLYYIVTAKDRHGNQSVPSNEATVTIPTGIEDATPSLTHLTLGGNFPNPFSASTRLRVGLPRASDIRLEVYDVAGRRVSERTIARAASGWHEVAFDGRSTRGERLPSGVYFYRVTAAGETRTHKMVIGR